MRSCAVLLLSFLAATAYADLPPPEGYVEQCTIARQCKKDEDGTTCSAWHGDRQKCKKEHATDGYTYKCSTRGASTWTEVYCRAKPKK